MKKVLLVLVMAAQLIAQTAIAQTFPVVNLTVSGTSVFTGTATLNGVVSVSSSNASVAVSDTSGTGAAFTAYLNNGSRRWTTGNTSSSSQFSIGRYVTGTFTDAPLTISNSTGLVTMVDGLTSTPITASTVNNTPVGASVASTGAFTTLSSSSTTTFTVRPTFNGATPWDSANLNFASPPQIGATTPGAATFSNLAVTGTITGVTGRLIGVQTFTSTGTYTPTTGTGSVIVRAVGGGGGGGGAATAGTSIGAVAQGGGAGAYAEGRITSGFSGVTVTIGTGGAGGPAGQNNGSTGGTTSFGAVISAPGGTGGQGSQGLSSPSIIGSQGPSAVATGGSIFNGTGAAGGSGFFFNVGDCISGSGAASPFGAGPFGSVSATSAGTAATSKGAGGSGASAINGSAGTAGGAGAPGLVIVYEYQ